MKLHPIAFAMLRKYTDLSLLTVPEIKNKITVVDNHPRNLDLELSVKSEFMSTGALVCFDNIVSK